MTRVYGVDEAREFLAAQGTEVQELATQVDGKFASGFIRATKPLAAQTGASPAGTSPTAAATPIAAATHTATATTDTANPAPAAASCCSSTCCGR